MFMSAYVVCYLFPNFAPFSPPKQLPMLVVDSAIPLVPWTFLIYTSDYFLVFLVVLMHPNEESFRRFARQAFFVLLACGAFFVFYPTTYPRPQYPQVSSVLVESVMWLVSHADTPNNCFPSLHVSLTGIATLSLRFARPKLFLRFVFWSFLIFASTLSTKQHYLMDVLAGLGVILLATLLDELWARRLELLSLFRIGVE